MHLGLEEIGRIYLRGGPTGTEAALGTFAIERER